MYACTPNARRTYLTLAALVATIGIGVRPGVAAAQRVTGSLDVALTVLPPFAPRPVTVTRFRVGRDGMASLRADFPTTSGTSQLFVTRVSSTADRFVAVRLLPDVARRSSVTDRGEPEVAYRIEVARAPDGGAPHDLRLRVECLVLAGT